MFRLHPQFYFIIFVMIIIAFPAHAKKKYAEYEVIANDGYYQDTLMAAKKITNPVSKSDSLQIIINLMETKEKKKNIK